MKNEKPRRELSPLSIVIRVVCFLAILALLLWGASMIAIPKRNGPGSGIINGEAVGFQSEAEDTLDFVGIGNSNLYCAVSPMELWGKYGYAGYVCGEPRQMLQATYQILSDVFETQSPRLVILEADAIFQATDVKHIAAQRLERIFPIFKYHIRWKVLKSSDFRSPRYRYRYVAKGYSYRTQIAPYTGGDYMKPTKVAQPIPPLNQYYLGQILELCRERGAEILIVSVPNATNWNARKHNGVKKFAESENLPFIDMNELLAEIGLDWSKDTPDQGIHLNYSGAKKATGYLGRYLTEHYSLPDRRGDPAYASWDTDYSGYLDKVGGK